jgi:integrase
VTKPLTPITIANLKPRARQYEVSDGGCAGLRVVVFPTRRKSFILRYRFRRLSRKLTLGPVLMTGNGEGEPDSAPELDTPLSLAAARELATKALRQARAGNDPAAAKRKSKEAQHAAEADTLESIAKEYLRRVGPTLRTLETQRRPDLDVLCKSPLGQQPIDQITRGQYTRQLDHIADTRGPVRSDRVLSALKSLLTWHSARSDFVSPLGRGGRRTSISERARTRVLSDDELRRVWLAAEHDKGPFGAFLRFTLLTATRRSESGGLHRSELSSDGASWIIPARRYKTGKKSGRDTLIPLSKAAQKIIAEQPVLGGYVFSADGSRPLSGFDNRKKQFDAVSGVSDYTLHDLRRTSRTLLSRAGISADHAEMCLGHMPGGVRATYDRYAYETEKRQAFEALGRQIEQIVRPPPAAKVADLASERGKRQR